MARDQSVFRCSGDERGLPGGKAIELHMVTTFVALAGDTRCATVIVSAVVLLTNTEDRAGVEAGSGHGSVWSKPAKSVSAENARRYSAISFRSCQCCHYSLSSELSRPGVKCATCLLALSSEACHLLLLR